MTQLIDFFIVGQRLAFDNKNVEFNESIVRAVFPYFFKRKKALD
jgi:hypothetical protein